MGLGASGRTIDESGPGARGEQPRLDRRHPGMRRALEHAAGVSEALEDLLVQELVPQPADEALDEGVLRWLARRDVVPVEPGPVGPRQDDKRAGCIFIDYLRNGRGTTAIGTWSPRARAGFPIAARVSWRQIDNGIRPDAFTMERPPARGR